MDDGLWRASPIYKYGIWSSERLFWPRAHSGYVFLAHAVDLIGHLLFEGEWRLDDMNVSLITVPLQSEIAAVQQSENRNLAEAAKFNRSISSRIQRQMRVKNAIISAAAGDQLSTYYRSEVDGSLIRVPPHLWMLDGEAGAILERCLVNPGRWMRQIDAARPGLVFVPESDLRKVDWPNIKLERKAKIAPLSLLPPETDLELNIVERHVELAIGNGYEAFEHGQAAGSDRQSSPTRASMPRLAEKQDTENWYRERVAAAVAAHVRYSRGEDEKAGRSVGIGRDRVRELRRACAPSEWHDGGAPTTERRRR